MNVDLWTLAVPLLLIPVVALFAFAGCGLDVRGTMVTPEKKPEDKKPEEQPPGAQLPPGTEVPVTPSPPTYPEVVAVTPQLRHHWRLSEAAGATVLIDSVTTLPRSGKYSGTGITLGTPGALRPKLPTETAAELDGTSGHAAVPYDLLFTSAPAFSVEAWIRPTANFTGVRAVVACFDTDPDSGWSLYVSPVTGGKVSARFGVGDATQFTFVGVDLGGGSTLDGWRHVVATYDKSVAGGTSVLYVNDGGPVRTSTESGAGYAAPIDKSPLLIGASPDASGKPANFFAGRIDEVAFYHRALTPAEVAAHFAAAF